MKTDLDDMDYDNAVKRDKRKFCAEILNPWPLKAILFILNMDLYFLVNGLFFTEDYLTDILYDTDGNFFDLISRFNNRILYIFFIGVIINYIVDCFFSEDNIIQRIFRREKDNKLFLKYEMIKFIKKVTCSYTLFIILSFFISIIIWYYVFCFNNIYPSVKAEWIITSIVVIFGMQILYLLKIILESGLRIISIKLKSEKLFKVSQFLS